MMKKYGQAELMYALMQVFLENEEHLTEQQKAEVANLVESSLLDVIYFEQDRHFLCPK